MRCCSILHYSLRLFLILACFNMSSTCKVFAQRSWDGGNASDVWGDNGNWNPDGSPIGEAISIGDLVSAAGAVTKLDADYSIDSLEITNGADVINSTDNGATTAFELLVNGSTTIANAGSSMTIYGGAPDGLDTNTLAISSQGTLFLNSQTAAGTAIVEVDSGAITNNANGSIAGNGLIQLTHAPAGITALLNNEGTLSVGNLGLLAIIPARTLQITATSSNARVDLDGAVGGAGIVNVNTNATLDIDVPLSDSFSGDLNLSAGATLDIESAWSIGGGTIDVNTPPSFIQLVGPSAHLAGGAITFFGGTFILDDAGDSLTFDASVTGTGGVINNSGTITFNAPATFDDSVDFNMASSMSSLVVNSTVTIETPDFDLDGIGALGSTTINSGGILALVLGAGSDKVFDHEINLNNGTLSVTSDAFEYTLNSGSEVNVDGGGTSTISGHPVTALGSINISGNSTLKFVAAEILKPDVVIEAGSVLDIASTAFYTGGSYTGEGLLLPGLASINSATTWDVAHVDLDDGPQLFLNADLTVNADSVELDGDGYDGNIFIDNATNLTVNLSNGGSWGLDLSSTMTYAGDAVADTYLSGSDFIIEGMLVNLSTGRIDSRLTIKESGRIIITPVGASLFLAGGDTLNPNRLDGGLIDGTGILAADSGRSMHGHGAIMADIDFNGTANLLADGGTLALLGTITDVNEIGTFDADGILTIATAWNTSTATTVRLRGGKLTSGFGAAITNDNATGIQGFGEINAEIVNNTQIDAKDGALLADGTTNSVDWDGTTNTGALNAVNGDLQIRDDAIFLFSGSATVNSTREFYTNGFALEWEPASVLNLGAQSRYRGSEGTRFGGSMTVAAGAPAEIRFPGTFLFENGSNSTLSGTLLLNNQLTQISVGAVLAGGGVLRNPDNGGVLRLQDGASVDVLVENQGTIDLGSAGLAGQVTGFDYQQDSTGTMLIDLGGTGLNQFDRYDLSGAVQLDGALIIDLFGGYVPTVGDTFDILSAGVSVTGLFSSVDQPFAMPSGLLFDVVYSADLVQLVVVEAPIYSADFDLDGDVDGDDLVIWQSAYGVDDSADADGDGDSDGRDFAEWQRQFGSVPLSASTAVPEPSGVLLSLIACAACSANRHILLMLR